MKSLWPIALTIAVTAPIAAWIGYHSGQSNSASHTRELETKLAAYERGIGRMPDHATPASAHTPSNSEPSPSRAANTNKSYSSVTDVLSIADPIERWKQMIAFAENLPPSEIPSAVSNIDSLPFDEMEIALVQFFIFAKFGADDPGAALASLEDGELFASDINSDPFSSSFPHNGFAHESIYGGWSGRDPATAAAYFTNTSRAGEPYAGHNGERIARAIAANWAHQDPRAAFEWVTTLHEDDRYDATEAVIGTWVAKDPGAAAAAALKMNPGEYRQDTLAEIAGRWAMDDLAAALTWATDLPAGDGDDALVVATRALANDDFPKAKSFVESMPPNDRRDRVLLNVSRRWDPTQPIAGIDWIRGLQPAADTEKHATQSIVATWADEDPFAAAEWLANESPGPGRDGAIVGLTSRIAGEDLERALQWSLTISDPKLRTSQLDRHASRWLENRPDTAAAWINSQPDFPPDLREELLSE
ncbi:MAG: hypothetical protein AAF591_18035 [Verrucomicrobiota bacterium]